MASRTQEQLFGAQLDPEAVGRGYEIGKDAGALRAQTGPVAFINAAIQAAQKQRATQYALKQEQFKAKVAQLQQIVLDDPKSPVAQRVMSDPNMAQLIGIDPRKSQAQQDPAAVIKALRGEGGGSGFPPGTTISTKTAAGTITAPLNQKLTEAEQTTVAGADTFGPLSEQINSLIDNGALEDNDYSKWLVQSGDNYIARALIPDGSDAEKLSSAIAQIRKYAFSDAGKALTKTEKDIVFQGFTLTGKSIPQIKQDVTQAIQTIIRKSQITLGGANAAKRSSSESSEVIGTFTSSSGKQYRRFKDGGVEWL